MQCRIAEGFEGPRTFEIRLKCPAAQQAALLAGLQRFGRNRIIDDGILNASTVSGFGDTLYFVVTDKKGQRGDNAYRTWKNEMKKVTCLDLRKLPEVAVVESVRPFTRVSQRRFCWGDAQATKEEVVAAVRESDDAELLAIMPEARSLIRRNELEHMPALFDAMRSGEPIGLADCRHQFFTENMGSARALGPCGACGRVESDAYTMGFTRCPTCACIRCKPCAANITSQQDQQQSLMEAYHEVSNSHVWTPSNEDCDVCHRGPCGCGGKHCVACRADVQTQQCACGIVRCKKCLHVHVWFDPMVQTEAAANSAQPETGDHLALPSQQQDGNPVTAALTDASSAPANEQTGCKMCGRAPRKVCSCGEARCEDCFLLAGGSLVETWSDAHPQHRPATCYITDQQKTKTSDKLEWLEFELGKDAGLIPFARKFRELFGTQSQKAKCLDLYRQYANIAKREERGPYRTVADAQKSLYSKECQVPPSELEEFQKLWDADAPRRCHETNSELPAGTPLGQHFCSPEHAHAGKQIFCTSVTKRTVVNGEEIVDRCNGKVAYRSACLVCTSCGQGADVAKCVTQTQERAADTELGKSLKRSAESLRIANNVWGKFDSQTDPNYVPAWTKRKRL